MLQDLWVGSAAGLARPENAGAVKDMYVVPACKCSHLKSAKGVRRPPSHDDVYDDDAHDDDRNSGLPGQSEYSDCHLKRCRT